MENAQDKKIDMRLTLKSFIKHNLEEASKKLLLEFGIEAKQFVEGVPQNDYFKVFDFNYQYVKEARTAVETIWHIGYAIKMKHQGDVDQPEESGQSLSIFACEIKPEVNFPRGIASALTRAFTRTNTRQVNSYYDMPVVVIMRQGTLLTLATCELTDRVDGNGHKVGRVTMLRNMDCCNLHAGHKQILERIAKDVQGSRSYDDLHQRWFKSFSIDVLSDDFFNKYKANYEDIIEFVTGKRMVKENGKWIERNNGNPCEAIMKEFKDFPDPEKAVRDYVKNLMGRLVFIQFLQKKEWMGVPDGNGWEGGDPEFLQNLFKNSDKKDTFIDDVLEPLFNDLNTKRHGDLVTNQNVSQNKVIKVPYLNGGLFELDESDDTTFALPSRFMQKLLDFFASYNFTIDENAPDDVEIGVDPEMLGRIFENLLEDNKEKGAFYTPKEIVQYMCRESLIAYLTTCVMKKQGENHRPEEDIRKAVRSLLSEPETIVPKMTKEHLEDFGTYIREVKICDPAIGSGAFPMGLLNELVRCRTLINAWAVDSYGNELVGDIAALKAEIIRNNIYGVDIEKGAIDIARLRFWLSIIVDEKTPEALPNFDYKFMQGNSLIPTFGGEYINLSTKKQNHTKVQDMVAVKQKILQFKKRFYVASGEEKMKLNILIKDHILQLISLQLGYEIQSWADSHREQLSINFDGAEKVTMQQAISQLPEERRRIVDLGKKLRAQLADKEVPEEKRSQIDIQFFDWRMMFTEVFDKPDGGFDIVIGNPPYVESRSSSVDDKQKSAIQKQLKERYIKADAECFPRGADLLIFFFELSFNIASPSGINSFITENSWLSTDYGCKFQQFILRNINTLGIIDSDYKYFDSADINTVITFFENKGFRSLDTIPFVHCHGDLSVHPYNIQDDTFSKDKTITVKYFNTHDEILSSNKWGFLFSIDDRLLQLLEKLSQKEDKIFRDKIDIGQGLNITKDCILVHNEPDASPYYISDNGPLYRWIESQYFVDNRKASKTRKKPVLILPRGLGTHFCCMNEVNGYTASYVEIYEKSKLSEEEKLNLWAFCNSSLCWVLREFTGRCNLGGGMLKAEATDLKRIPLCFNFDELESLKQIYNSSINEKVPTDIDTAVKSPIHQQIDDIVFNYFGLPKENFVIELLLNRFHWRTDKSKNKRKKK